MYWSLIALKRERMGGYTQGHILLCTACTYHGIVVNISGINQTIKSEQGLMQRNSLMSNTQLLINQPEGRIVLQLINSCVLLISEFHYYTNATMSPYSVKG